jgi:hypothetical protein
MMNPSTPTDIHNPVINHDLSDDDIERINAEIQMALQKSNRKK